MKTRSLLCAVAAVGIFLVGGCVSRIEYDKCVRRNVLCQERVEQLLKNQENQHLDSEKWQQQIDYLADKEQALQMKLQAMQNTLAEKNALIERLSGQIGQPMLPEVLSNALADWARQSGSDLVTYDAKSGVVRFKSDLLFDKGEDTVTAQAKENLESLSKILNSAAAEGFDVLIVGHTDDIPILKPATLAKHPTNWHLSAHRAIAVEKVLAGGGIAEPRLSVVGMGEFRPIEPNKSNKQGNPNNRRVEIYIVPAGQLQIANPETAKP
ncbi:MAG: OmpA family protein [Sedimentisphaerales bacterium]|nr:OmpA family protein [Sedimentisphaerales bacterium]